LLTSNVVVVNIHPYRGREGLSGVTKRILSSAARRRRPETKRPRAPYHHGNLREAILQAALKLVETVGPRGITLRATARLAGVSQAAPYRHFASKEALLAAVAEEGFRALAAMQRESAARHQDDPMERFRALGLAYIAFATSRPAHFRVMFAPEVADKLAYPALAQAAAETFALLVDVIAECQKARTVKAGDPMELALAAWSIVHGFSALVVDRQLSDLYPAKMEEKASNVTQHLFDGLALRP
jgi:AcrR family transcriptional regulator